MTITMVFPLVVATLNLCAALVYFYHHQPMLGALWVCYTVSTVLLAGLK